MCCSMNMRHVKNVVWPICDVVPIHTIRGFLEDFGQLAEDVALLAGVIRYERKSVRSILPSVLPWALYSNTNTSFLVRAAPASPPPSGATSSHVLYLTAFAPHHTYTLWLKSSQIIYKRKWAKGCGSELACNEWTVRQVLPYCTQRPTC